MGLVTDRPVDRLLAGSATTMRKLTEYVEEKGEREGDVKVSRPLH